MAPMVRDKSSIQPGLMPIVVTIVLSAGILIALWISGARELSNTESVLVAILLSSASMLVSWLVTHLYSQISLRDTIKQATDSNTENIRNLGVRAAEKVLNLSSELQRLVDAMTTTLEESEDMEGSEQSTMFLRERILSAVHNLETLKSMNDTFLSDWRGVIGEEIERQHVLEQQIDLLTNELYKQIGERESLRATLVSPADLAAVQSRIEETERRLTEKIVSLPFKVHPKARKPRKEDVKIPCTSCGDQLEIRLRLRKGARKLIKCPTCDNYSLVSVINDGVLEVESIPLYHYAGTCPMCSSEITEELPDHPGATVSTTCKSCDVKLLLSKSSQGANLRMPTGSRRQIQQNLVGAVRDRLPQRPWPKHIHKSIAAELGVPNSMVSRIIGSLVGQGQFPIAQDEDDSSEKSPDGESETSA